MVKYDSKTVSFSEETVFTQASLNVIIQLHLKNQGKRTENRARSTMSHSSSEIFSSWFHKWTREEYIFFDKVFYKQPYFEHLHLTVRNGSKFLCCCAFTFIKQNPNKILNQKYLFYCITLFRKIPPCPMTYVRGVWIYGHSKI